MTPPLPAVFLSVPIAHRALHDLGAGRPENSMAAVEAAVRAGYGIEIDVQLSSDGAAMVFHDDHLGRLTAETGLVRDRTAAELSAIPLKGGGGTIPRLSDVLAAVGGRVPLLIEVKDQDGRMGPRVGALEQAVAIDLARYEGPVAVMSFNPHSVDALRHYAPSVPRGITTTRWEAGDEDADGIAPEVRRRLREIADFDRVGASFISHDAHDLARDRVVALRARGVPVLCWTIRSPEAEAEARKLADNVTFEGYAAPVRAA